jgi:hypothetical protein
VLCFAWIFCVTSLINNQLKVQAMKKIKKTFLVIFGLLISCFISTAKNEKIPVTSSSEKAVNLYQQAWSVQENAEIAKAHQLLEEDYENAYNSFMKAYEPDNAWSQQKAIKAKELIKEDEIPFTAEEILEKSIQFHDPDGKWKSFSGALKLIFTNPTGYTAGTEIIEIDVTSDFYKCTRIQGGIQYVKGIKDGKSFISFNGDSHPTANQIEEFGLNNDQIEQMKDWHFFHFGKMMFLKEIGAELLGEVTKKEFNGRECYQITLNVPEEMVKIQSLKGKNIFHLDASNFELAGFQNSVGTAFYNGSLEINGIKTAIVGRYFSPDNNDFFGVDLFSRADDHFRLPVKYQTQSKPNGSNNSLKTTHLLKLENEETLRKLEQPLKEINETLAEMGYPECGYVIYKVNDDYESDYTHIMEGWWMCKEVYDLTHNHPKYKALAEKYDELFGDAMQNGKYFRVEKMMPKLY